MQVQDDRGVYYMKKLAKLFSAAAAVVFMLSAPLTHALAADNLKELSQKKPFVMTVLGDSIAAGYGLEGHERDKEPCYGCNSYANILAAKYELTAEKNYFNDAVSGATSSDLLLLLDDKEVSQHVKNSDTVLISIGGNDLLHILLDQLPDTIPEDTDESGEVIGENVMGNIDPLKLAEIFATIGEKKDEALENFKINMNALAVKLRTLNPAGLIIVNTQYDPFEDFKQIPGANELIGSSIDELNKIINDNATDEAGNVRYIVVDVAADFEGKSTELTNISQYDIHPNASGHEEISVLLDKEITSHTFTRWVIDENAAANSLAEQKKAAQNYSRVMFGFFFMLMILIAVLFVHSMQQLKKK